MAKLTIGTEKGPRIRDKIMPVVDAEPAMSNGMGLFPAWWKKHEILSSIIQQYDNLHQVVRYLLSLHFDREQNEL